MPVTITPSPEKIGTNTDYTATSSAHLLSACERMKQPGMGFASQSRFDVPCKGIMYSSFADLDGAASSVVPYANGFLEGVVRAYQQDLHLVLRPDDVWLAVITQFSFYVAGNAEELRGKFVAHDGKKELELLAGSSPEMIKVPSLMRKLTCLIEEHLVDTEIRNWIIPDFSTTTDNDIAVASMTMMATMKEYFSYSGRTGCGFPSVTLLGEKEDWVKMRQRLDLLPNYGAQPAAWSQLLVPVFDRFVATFERPDDESLKTFWLTVCHAERGGSGNPDTLSGWMTAFAYWNTNGSRNPSVYRSEKRSPRAKPFKPQLTLDGQLYPIIDHKRVPHGVCQVPVLIKDMQRRVNIYTEVVAGSVGMSLVKDDGESATVQPRSGWWMLYVRKQSFA